MTAPHAMREVTVWNELTKTIESVLESVPKINITPISSGITKMTDSLAYAVNSPEVNFSPPIVATL